MIIKFKLFELTLSEEGKRRILMYENDGPEEGDWVYCEVEGTLAPESLNGIFQLLSKSTNSYFTPNLGWRSKEMFLPHIVCWGHTKEEVEQKLKRLRDQNRFDL